MGAGGKTQAPAGIVMTLPQLLLFSPKAISQPLARALLLGLLGLVAHGGAPQLPEVGSGWATKAA